MASTDTTGTIAAYFENHANAEQAVHALRDAGFTSAHIGVAHRGSDSTSSDTTGTSATEKAGGMWDKVKNFFEGGAEPYADERTSGDLATREITSDPSASPTAEGGLRNHLSGLSVPEDRSRYLGHRFDSADNGAVVTVNAGSREADVEAILTRFGGDIGANAADYDYSAATTPSTLEAPDTKGVEGTQNIQLLGEMMRVHKEKVSRGEVSFRKEVITETQTIQVPVTREELVIERHAVSGSTPASGTIGDTGEIRIPLSQEVASVDKSTVVREEVSVGKRTVEDVRDLSGDVRHEELIVEDETKKIPTR